MTFEERRQQEEQLNRQRQAFLDRLRNEYDRRRTLDQSINQQIEKLEGKGDSQIIQLVKTTREYQQSLSASIDAGERLIAGIVADANDIAEDNSKALEDAEDLIDRAQPQRFQTNRLKDKIRSIQWKQRRYTRLHEGMENLIAGRPQNVET
jgi:hypothetical protein